MSIIPYTSVYIDADWRDFLASAARCFSCTIKREEVMNELQVMWTNSANQNPVLPCLSVRTGLDLFLKVKDYPVGSEVIMSAINIPDMVHIVRHHKLKIVPFDISIETTAPKVELLESLITDKTVAVLVAHIYGKWCDINPMIDIAHKRNLDVIEDCAECFCGFERLGNPRSDISLFSFGVIKFYTAFGGAIAKVKDKNLYTKMEEVYRSYPVQKHSEYLKKLVKYFVIYTTLDWPRVSNLVMKSGQIFNIDHKKYVVKFLRGFPDKIVERIRAQPSNALLVTMKKRLAAFSLGDFNLSQIKAEYVRARLPESVTLVGMQAEVNNYWLFPVLMESPDTMVKLLNALGVDAYRGVTQLNLIEPENQNLQSVADINLYEMSNRKYPHEAGYLINQVIYLPVNKSVPFHVLDQICRCIKLAVRIHKNGHSADVRLKAKL